MTTTLIKQPADQRDYDIDFSRWIPDDDTITSATAVVTEIDPLTDIQVESVQIVAADAIVKVWISGGLDGSTYKITVTASTTDGRIKETEFKLRVRDY